jgi:isochorismate synthase
MKAFALIREPGNAILCLPLSSEAIGPFVFSPFFGVPERFSVGAEVEGQEALTLAREALKGLERPILSVQSSHDAFSYQALVEKAVKACDEGALEKVVLSRCKAYPDPGIDPVSTYERLCVHYPQATVYMVHRAGQSLWMGATPECLVEMQENSVKTMSLAGTRVAGIQGPWGTKEREEQHVVTRDITHMLHVLGCKNLTIEGPNVLNAGPVEHLCSIIHGERNGSSANEVAQALHPTPAVGGLPRAQAATFIRQREGYDRKFYAGYFGWDSGQRAVYYVNLRCLEWGQNGLLCYAGGGITAKSKPQEEWEETEQKLKTLERVIFG